MGEQHARIDMDGWESLVPQQFNSIAEKLLSEFCDAAFAGNVPKMEEMLERKQIKDVNESSPRKKETPLHYACRGNQIETIKLLLKHGADVNKKDAVGRHGFHLSCSTGHLEAVKLLIQHNASLEFVDKYNRSCLHWSAVNKHLAVVHELVNAGAPLHYERCRKWQPIHEAAKGGDVNILRLIIDRCGANIVMEQQQIASVTPLHVAAREGHLDCLQLLLKHKHPVNPVNQGMKTPLHEAAFKGAKECCRQLILKGANPHAKDNLFRTPLLEACNQGHLPCAILLLDAGSFVNHSDRRGLTALHHLLAHNTERIPADKLAAFVDVLLQYGAKFENRDVNDVTPMMLANQLQETDAAHVIQTAMDTPMSLMHAAKICCRKIIRCEFESINEYNIPTNLKIYLLQNSSYYSGW